MQCFFLDSMVTQWHMHVHVLFHTWSCSILSDETQFPGLHSGISLRIHSKGNSLHLLTPSSSGFFLKHIFLVNFFSFQWWSITGYWIEFPVPDHRSLLFTHLIHNSVCMFTPTSSFIPPLTSPLPLENHKFVFYVCESVSVLQRGSSVSLFRFHIKAISWNFSFSLELASHGMIISRSIHVVTNGVISFFSWLSSIPLYVCTTFHCMYVPRPLYPLCCWHLGCFHVLAIVNSAAMSTGVHVSFQTMVFSR